MEVATGYVVLDRDGEFLAWSSDFGAAKACCDAEDTPDASRVDRCSDGAVVAFHYAKKKSRAERWDEAVPA